MLSTNLDKRYFEALKTKVHFLGVCYVDREIAQLKTGRKNIVNGKEEVLGKVQSESRVICFRDEGFSVDAKSRFADITSERIPMNVDAMIKAITDAIKKEHDKGPTSYEDDLKKQAAEAKAVEKVHQARIDKFKLIVRTKPMREIAKLISPPLRLNSPVHPMMSRLRQNQC